MKLDPNILSRLMTTLFLLQEDVIQELQTDTKEELDIADSIIPSLFSSLIFATSLLLLVACISCVNKQQGEITGSQAKEGDQQNVSFQKFLRQNGISIANQFDNEYEQLQAGNFYTNHYYNLTIDFPDHWDIDRGPHEYSVIRAFEADSGISFTLAVIPEPFKSAEGSENNRNTMEHLKSITNGDPVSFYRDQLTKQSGVTPEDLSVKDVKIGRYQFLGPIYRIKQQFPSGTIYYMRILTLNTTLFNNAYSVSYSAPDGYFNMNILESVLNRFQVIAPSIGYNINKDEVAPANVGDVKLPAPNIGAFSNDRNQDEDFLKKIYTSGSFENKASFDQFKADMLFYPELRKRVYKDFGYDKQQTFKEFEKKIGIDPDFLPPLPIYDQNTTPVVVPNPGHDKSALREFYRLDDQGYLAEKRAADVLNTPGDVLTVAKANVFRIDKDLKLKGEPEYSFEALGNYLQQARLISDRSRMRLKILYSVFYDESEIDKIVDTYTAMMLMGQIREANEFLLKYPALSKDPNVENVYVANQRLRDVSLAEHHVRKKYTGSADQIK